MEGLIDVVVFCAGFGIITLCIVLVIAGVLRWLAPNDSRAKRLNLLAWIALIVLIIVALAYNYAGTGTLKTPSGNGESGMGSTQHTMEADDGGDAGDSPIFSKLENNGGILCLLFGVSKNLIGLLIFGVVAASTITILIVVAFCIYTALRIIITDRSNSTGANNGGTATPPQNTLANSTLEDIIGSPIVKMVLAWGILALFFILPILVGDPGSGQPIEVWENGANKIVELVDFSDESENSSNIQTTDLPEGNDLNVGEGVGTDANAKTSEKGSSRYILTSYVLIYIMILGVGYAVIKILYSIIDHSLENNSDKTILDEYSSPIALLAVGISFLWAIKDGGIPRNSYGDTILELLKSFGTVLIIFAVIVLVLEIVRLLLDLGETLIRDEGRILFIALAGQSAMLILGILVSIYDAVNSAIGDTGADMGQIEAKLRERIIQLMDAQIERKKDHKMTFSAFDEKTTKK